MAKAKQDNPSTDEAVVVDPTLEAEAGSSQAAVPDATSAETQEVAAALPASPASERDTMEIRAYADELVKAAAEGDRAEATARDHREEESFVKIEKLSLAIFAQVYVGDNYTEFALDDVVAVRQTIYADVQHTEVQFAGGGGAHFTSSKADADEFLKAWRSKRSTQRR